MAISIPDLCRDLSAETEVLSEVLDTLDDIGWTTATPAAGWSVLDQVVHLAYFDEAVTIAVVDPDRFRLARDAAMARGSLVDEVAAANRGRPGSEIAAQFARSRAAMVDAFLRSDPAARVPWYGPEMSVASALTARIMETWAHGQDVFDAFDRDHRQTSALRQVAHIGVRALPNSYITKGLSVPADPVRVELGAPDGEQWTWGPVDAVQRVTGPAVDFCLVATQRRNIADTSLVTEGDVATEWMHIAQAFAGAAGSGRAAGQFNRSA